MIKIKICGITNLEDALLCTELGANALGFVFVPSSPRAVNFQQARKIIEKLPPFISTVGVFVNPSKEEIENAVKINIIQLHGEETPAFCRELNKKIIKAIRVKDKDSLPLMKDYSVDAFLLDTFSPDRHGGTGQVFDWNLAVAAKKYGKIILSGGLNPENIAQAIREVEPYGVDASSGLEASPGKKDHKKLREFFKNIKNSGFRYSRK